MLDAEGAEPIDALLDGALFDGALLDGADRAPMRVLHGRVLSPGEPDASLDHVVISVKGQRSSFSVEVYFARDAARTPLSIKVPLGIGTLSAELVR